VTRAKKFNQGFDHRIPGAAMLDQRWHQLAPPDPADGVGFEARAEGGGRRLRAGAAALPHHLLQPHHGRLSAGYYAYIWSEVLDADTVEWFKENGGLKRKNGDCFAPSCCRAAAPMTR
jgi:peptidyl-dipeptidase Dcp